VRLGDTFFEMVLFQRFSRRIFCCLGKARVVRTIDERIEILTGVKAGARRSDGTFEDGTLNYRGDKRLREMAKNQEFS